MWIVYLITLTNAILSYDVTNSTYMRFTLVGFPINIFDIFMILGLMVCMLEGRSRYVPAEPHRLTILVLSLFVLGFTGAAIGATGNGADIRTIVTTARNLAAIPIFMFLGSRLLPRLKSAERFVYVQLAAAIVVSVFELVDFHADVTDLSKFNNDINNVRVVGYLIGYAGIMAALLLFSMGSGIRLLSKPFAVPALALCAIAQCITLSRSDWLAITAACFAAFCIMPKRNIGKMLGVTFVTGLTLILAVWGTVLAIDKVSGKDVAGQLFSRFESMLPGEHENVEHHAWDTRLGGSIYEVQLFLHNPLMGKGFGIQDTISDAPAGLRHNTWTSTLAESGIFGFSAMLVLAVGQIAVGRRLVKAQLSRGSILIGALGVITGSYFIVHGLATMSFNTVRGGIAFAITFGLVMRTRQLQLAVSHVYAGHLEGIAEENLVHSQLAPILDDSEVEIGEMAVSGYGDQIEIDEDAQLEAQAASYAR